MNELEKYIAKNKLENHPLTKHLTLLYNEAVKTRKKILQNKRIEEFEHKNGSVMFLVCASIEYYDVLKNNYKLNTDVFDYKMINESIADMLSKDSAAKL